MQKYKRSGLLLALVAGVASLLPMGAASAATTATQAANFQAVARAYGSTVALQSGVIVQLAAHDKTKVTAATYPQTTRVFGVVVPSTAPVTVTSSSSAAQQAYVMTTGQVQVLVSTQNGVIHRGDLIGVSAASGIGMKADDQEAYVVGHAAGNFDGKTAVLSHATLQQKGGQRTVAIGMVPVAIGIGANPQLNGGALGAVQQLAVRMVGKSINMAQLYAAMATLLAGIAVMATLLYSSIQTGMAAIGRNPLARRSISRNMLQVITASFSIFIGSLVAVYLILKL